MGETWVERTVRALGEVAGEVVVAGDGKLPHGLKKRVQLPDVLHVEGPMAGILAAMRWNPGVSWLVAACDMPEISLGALKWLLTMRQPGAWAVIPKIPGESNEIQPLLAYYGFRSQTLLEQAARLGDFSFYRLAAHAKVVTPEPPQDLRGAWKNINTVEDLQKHRAKLSGDN
jgi:glutamate dehydrogenase (NADP+)/cyclic pyranopterin phosphate synthase/molybdopterin-guanine dinucleotide biosynthesis protein A